MIAYSLADRSIRILKTENGEKATAVDCLHESEVVDLRFCDYHSMAIRDFLPFEKGSLESRLILPVSPHRNCNKYIFE